MKILKEQLKVPLLDYITEGNVSRKFQLDSELKMKAAEAVLSNYSQIIEGEREKKNITSFAEHYLQEYYAANLKSRTWSKRMNALYYIEDFRLTVLQEAVLDIATRQRASLEERVHALHILASFQYSQLFQLLTADQRPLSDHEYRNILLRLENKEFESFILGFQHCPDPLKWAILDVIGINKDITYTSFVENVFHSNQGEVCVRAIKALASIGYVENVKLYLPLSNADQWQYRMLAAKLFGSLKDSSLVPVLTKLLHDPAWYVRSQAAQSIMMNPDGKNILQEVLIKSQDPFARDMAWEWINKGD